MQVLNQINGMVVKEMRKGKTGKAKTISFSATGAGERIVEVRRMSVKSLSLISIYASILHRSVQRSSKHTLALWDIPGTLCVSQLCSSMRL